MKKFDAKEHIKALNQVRASQMPMSAIDMRYLLKQIGLPSNSLFWSILSSSDLIIKLGYRQYQFINEPIHYTKLEAVYAVYKERVDSYANKHRLSKKLSKNSIKRAVAMLKNQGFEIYAPVGKLFQKL